MASPARFIGVTGSSAKSTTTALLGHILAAKGRVATQADSNVAKALAKTILSRGRGSDFVVAELGVGGKGQMQPMAGMLKPDVALVTLVALEHRTSFKTLEAVAEEKGALVENVRAGGFALLNADDPQVMSMAARTRERIVTFGREAQADYRATNVRAGYPGPLRLRLEGPAGALELEARFLAEHFWLSVAAASAAALELGLQPAVVAAQVASFVPGNSRFELISVEGGPDFIVDTIKAPWHSLPLSIEAMRKAQAPRKRFVLGQISDFTGSNTKYRDVYRVARDLVDQVMFVGEHSHRSKATDADIASGRFEAFAGPKELADRIRETAVPGELIMLKASGALHLERVAMSFVKDVKCWVPACGRAEGCEACGLYGMPFDLHRGKKRWKRRGRLRALLWPRDMLNRVPPPHR
jgi:UDP-N-acetylmuramoyl-tripeptide--D-alanyl-D-alanine ligase